MLKKLFGPKEEKVAGYWKKFHYEEPYDLDSSLNIILVIKQMRMRWVGHVAYMGGEEKCSLYKVWVAKHEENVPLGRLSRRKAWDRFSWLRIGIIKSSVLAHAVMNIRVPQNAGNQAAP